MAASESHATSVHILALALKSSDQSAHSRCGRALQALEFGPGTRSPRICSEAEDVPSPRALQPTLDLRALPSVGAARLTPSWSVDSGLDSPHTVRPEISADLPPVLKQRTCSGSPRRFSQSEQFKGRQLSRQTTSTSFKQSPIAHRLLHWRFGRPMDRNDLHSVWTLADHRMATILQRFVRGWLARRGAVLLRQLVSLSVQDSAAPTSFPFTRHEHHPRMLETNCTCRSTYVLHICQS